MTDHLIAPHGGGGALVDLTASPARQRELREGSREWPSWDLTPRQLCDLELLLNGGFSPLDGFLRCVDYERVCRGMRLASGGVWAIPGTPDVPGELRRRLSRRGMSRLRAGRG